MRALQFLREKIIVEDKRFRTFYLGLVGTSLLSYLNDILIFLPRPLFGLNSSGIAWFTMFIITFYFLIRIKKSFFPIVFWLPWLLYLFLYLMIDFSFVGMQLTLQYSLPIFIGIVASQFEYTWQKLRWLFQVFFKLMFAVYLLFVIYKILIGFAPNMAATPMLLLLGATLSIGLFFMTKKRVFIVLYFLLFLMPFFSVTRMALVAFAAVFIFHFANNKIVSKIVAGVGGMLLLLVVVNSSRFQEKTFYEGKGNISEINLDYYDDESINSSGRKSWKIALESGLEKEPLWGNGPRADAAVLGEVIGKEVGEAHNDYMSVRYNYGYVGLSLLLSAFGFTFIRLYLMRSIIKEPEVQLLVSTGLTLFIPFLLFMYSDNILKYTVWFPNYFFALIGIVYSIYKKGYFHE